MMRSGILPGIIIGTGLLILIRSLIPARPRLDDALMRLTPSGPFTPETDDFGDDTALGDLQRSVGRHGGIIATRIGLKPPLADLRLTGRSTQWYWATKSTWAVGGFIAPLAITALNTFAGSPLPPAIPVAMSFVGALYGWLLPNLRLAQQARVSREAFTRAAVSYLQLMAIHRNAGSGAVQAMRGAAEVSDSWMFVRIREELTRAHLAGVSAWDGVSALGDRTGIPALREVGDIMRLAGTQGGGVSSALLARARAMRHKILSDEHTKALKATTRMSFPILVLVFTVIAIFGVPSIARFLAI